MPLQDRIAELKSRLEGAPTEELTTVLREGLSELVGKSYAVTSGRAVDRDGAVSQDLSILIQAVDGWGSPPADHLIPVDNIAVVIAVVDELTSAALAEAYASIASVKALQKAPEAEDAASHTNATLGVVYARKATPPVDEFADQLEQLNAEHPSDQWPDLLCVGDKALIQYCVQFPGSGRLGMWFPATPGGFERGAPAVYIVMVRTPSDEASFRRVMGLVFQFLHIFRNDAELPEGVQNLAQAPGEVLPATTYQYDLAGNLRPLRDDQNRERLTPDASLQIVSQRGEPLAGLRYMPWQDGGAVIMEGKFPLEGLLLLGDESQRVAVLRPEAALQISYVMPMGRDQFEELLRRFQAKSNLRVERPAQKWIVRRLADEGTSSPYVARLILGALTIRDATIEEAARDRFDTKFERAQQTLTSIRESATTIRKLWAEHEAAIREGRIVRRSRSTLHILTNIDRKLRGEIEGFLNAAARLLKLNMQELAAELGSDMGFLFKKQAAFEAGLTRLAQQDAPLAAYLEQVRARWSERLITARNAIEHEGWMLPPVHYEDRGALVVVSEPQVSGEGVSSFVETMLDRLCCFMEDVTIHLLSGRLSPAVALTEVPPKCRSSKNPARFEFTLANGGRDPWCIAYNDTPFLQR